MHSWHRESWRTVDGCRWNEPGETHRSSQHRTHRSPQAIPPMHSLRPGLQSTTVTFTTVSGYPLWTSHFSTWQLLTTKGWAQRPPPLDAFLEPLSLAHMFCGRVLAVSRRPYGTFVWIVLNLKMSHEPSCLPCHRQRQSEARVSPSHLQMLPWDCFVLGTWYLPFWFYTLKFYYIYWNRVGIRRTFSE